MTAHYLLQGCFLAFSISTTGENGGIRPEISFPFDRCGHTRKGQKRSGDDDFKDARGSPRGNRLLVKQVDFLLDHGVLSADKANEIELWYSELVSLRNAPSCNM
ncbi:hypothetical protein K449DRAFT_360995 [Hypoxylon sp. EC38]|nr:hypothetical protein K449DRAFT_360995 [Hypoxylon sp. EC38]